MISSLTNIVQKRKGKLATYLNNNTDELSLEKQHQLYGAIVELENIVAELNKHRNKEIDQESNPDEIFLFKPIHSKGVIGDVKDFISDFF
jgi:hypothetical protein